MGLEGIDEPDEPDEQALYVTPYDAGAASEGTPRTPTHGIPSPLHSPGPAPSVDGAAAMPIIDGEAKKQLQSNKQNGCKFLRGNVKWQKKQSTKQRRF